LGWEAWGLGDGERTYRRDSREDSDWRAAEREASLGMDVAAELSKDVGAGEAAWGMGSASARAARLRMRVLVNIFEDVDVERLRMRGLLKYYLRRRRLELSRSEIGCVSREKEELCFLINPNG